MGPLRSRSRGGSKTEASEVAQDPDHDAKSHPRIANGSIGRLKFYRQGATGRDCSLILNLVTIRNRELRTISAAGA
jgi:hypothetical protein